MHLNQRCRRTIRPGRRDWSIRDKVGRRSRSAPNANKKQLPPRLGAPLRPAVRGPDGGVLMSQCSGLSDDTKQYTICCAELRSHWTSFRPLLGREPRTVRKSTVQISFPVGRASESLHHIVLNKLVLASPRGSIKSKLDDAFSSKLYVRTRNHAKTDWA